MNQNRTTALILLSCLSAATAMAQSDPYQDWRQALDRRNMDILEYAAWFRTRVGKDNDADVARLRRFVLDPLLPRSIFERTGAAVALTHSGIHHLEAALESPHADVRRAASLAIMGRVHSRYLSSDLISRVDPEKFKAHGYSPSTPIMDLLEGLRSKDANERVFCTAVLRSYRPHGSVRYRSHRRNQLLEALDDRDPVYRRGAALGLRVWFLGKQRAKVTERLQKAMKDPDAQVRRAAAEAIACISNRNYDEVITALAAGLDDEEDLVAAACAASLYLFYNHGCLAIRCTTSLCESACRKRAPFARSALVRVISAAQQHGDEETSTRARNIVLDALADPAPLVRLAAVRAVRLLDTASREEVIHALLILARDPAPAVRAAVMRTLSDFRESSPRVLLTVSSVTDDESPAVRCAALFALQMLRPQDRPWAARQYAAHLEDTDHRVRRAATCGLDSVGKAALPYMQDLLDLLEDDRLNGIACRVILKLGAEAAPPLVTRLKSAGFNARFDLVDILRCLGAPALPALLELLESDDVHLQEVSLSGLGRMGPAGYPAEANLMKRMADGPRSLHPLVAWALFRICMTMPLSDTLREAATRHRWCAWVVVQLARHRGNTFGEASPVLLSLLHHRNPLIQEAAADALVALGARPPPADPWFADAKLPNAALIERLGDSSAATRKAALRTLLTRPDPEAPDIRAVISRTFGIEVNPPGTTGSGPGWFRLPEIKANGLRLQPEAIRVAERSLLSALVAYPPSMIRPRLKEVVLLEKLRVRGTTYGGTYRDHTLYLAAGRHLNLDLAALFHHEFSSLLMNSTSFPATAWKAIHGAGHQYGKGGRHAILMGRTGVGTVALFRKGFFTPYALADLENDFNVFSETVMTYPVWADAMAARYPRLGQKWKIWHAFLKRIDPSFEAPHPLQGTKCPGGRSILPWPHQPARHAPVR